jgi:hypothetical protein
MYKTVLLYIFYVLLFLVVGYFLYVKFFPTLISSGDTVQQTGKEKGIYYSINNNLYKLNPDITNNTQIKDQVTQVQSTGLVSNISFSKDNDYFIYDTVTSKNIAEIWKVYTNDNNSEKLFSALTPGLENFTNFRNPIISPDNTKIGFIATHGVIDDLFIQDLTKKQLTNLTNPVIQESINSWDWSNNSNGIVFSTFVNNAGFIYTIDLDKNLKKIYTDSAKFTKVNYLTDKIVFLSNLTGESPSANIKGLKISDNSVTNLTDVANPKQVNSYNISTNKRSITYDLSDSQTKATDIYIEEVDGTNLLQVTTDNKSSSPIFSADGNKISYVIKDSGIYIMNINKTNITKILNSKEIINNLIIWR